MDKVWFVIMAKEDRELYKKAKKFLKSNRIKFSNSRWFKMNWTKVRFTSFGCSEEKYNELYKLINGVKLF